MIRFYNIVTWIVICLSIFILFLIPVAILLVGFAGHSSGSFSEAILAIGYFITLALSLLMVQSLKYKNRFTTVLAGIMLLIGMLFCLYDFFDVVLHRLGGLEDFVAGIPLILLLITFAGLIKNRSL